MAINCCKFLVELVLSILSLFFFILVLLPGLTIIFLPFYVLRLFLIGYVKIFRKDFVKIMGGNNPILAIDDIHGKKGRPLHTVVGMGAFDTDDIESCKEFAKTSVFAIDSKTKELLYPESQQYYEEWFGFIWWKWEQNFDISEHITIWEESKTNFISEDDFIKIVGRLEASKFPHFKSPWEVVLVGNVILQGVQNPERPKTIVIFRFHHGFADGLAMMQLFMRCVFTDSFDKVAKPVFVERSEFQKRMYQLYSALALPYQFLKQGITSMDKNHWHIPEKKLTRTIHKAWSSRIPISLVSEITEIKGQYNVGFTAVLVSALAGAIREMMIKSKVPVPKKIHAILPLPWPNHPQGLTNHWSYGFMELPIGVSDMKKRLIKIHKYIEEMKKSPVPALNFAVLKFANLFPTWIIKRIMVTNFLPTVILSNFPGPPKDSRGIGGLALVDSMFTGGPLRGNIGISITILSYDGALRIVTGIDSAILPTQEMTKEFMQHIETEFVNLRQAELV